MKVAFLVARTDASVSVVRQALDGIFQVFGVTQDCREKIALAVSEACANAVQHADDSTRYRVSAEADDSQCVIEVLDDGAPAPIPRPPQSMPPPVAESGRGLAIIRLVADSVELRHRGRRGLVVRMSKQLTWDRQAFGAVEP